MSASRRLLALTGAAVAVFLVAEFVLDLTSWGQAWDDSALLEARMLPEAVWDTCDTLLRIIRIPSIIAAAIACLVIAAARRQLLTGVVAVAATAAAIVSAEAIKFLTPRPDLAPDLTLLVDNAGANTFPSGHATLATALGMSFVMVVAHRWRPWTAAVVFILTSLFACSTVIAGWHRPSDAIGGIAFATAWLALAAWALSLVRCAPTPGGARSPALVAALVWALVAGTGIVALSLVSADAFLAAFATAEAILLLVSGAAVGGYASALRRVDFSA